MSRNQKWGVIIAFGLFFAAILVYALSQALYGEAATDTVTITISPPGQPADFCDRPGATCDSFTAEVKPVDPKDHLAKWAIDPEPKGYSDSVRKYWDRKQLDGD